LHCVVVTEWHLVEREKDSSVQTMNESLGLTRLHSATKQVFSKTLQKSAVTRIRCK
jgi:hypothetical protein